MQSNGRAAGQDVFHYHLHIVPRFAGDNIILNWDNTPASSEKLSQIAAGLRAGLN